MESFAGVLRKELPRDCDIVESSCHGMVAEGSGEPTQRQPLSHGKPTESMLAWRPHRSALIHAKIKTLHLSQRPRQKKTRIVIRAAKDMG